MLRQRLSQKQIQKLSPQQIQLMKLLQVPTATLDQRIQEELEANPALDEGQTDDSEDDQDISELLQFNLTNEGFVVKTETRGDLAYRKIIEQKPDLLILDLNLPGLSGIEICK